MNTHRNATTFLSLLVTATMMAPNAFAQLRWKQMNTGETLTMTSGATVSGLPTPSGSGDAAPKSYVDSQIGTVSAGLDPKGSVRLCSDGILDDNTDISGSPAYNSTGGASARGQITATLAVSGTLSLDGVTVVSGNRVMIHDEGEVGGLGADANGVYTVTIAGTALTLDRATDFDEDAEVTAGAYFFVEEGTTCGGRGYVLAGPDPLTVGGVSGSNLIFNVFSQLDLASVLPQQIDATDTGAIGTSAQAARADHEHAVNTAAPSANQTPDAGNSLGVSAALARADHGHNIPADVPNSILAQDTAQAEGTASSFARSDHAHALTVGVPTGAVNANGNTGTEGTSTEFVRLDHVHPVQTAAAVGATVGQSSTEGAGTPLARADHTHAHVAGTPSAVGTANATGASNDFVRADHVHDSPSVSKADQKAASAVTTGANETTGLTITNSPALGDYPRVYVNGVLYEVGDAVKTEDFFYIATGGTCGASAARAINAIVATDILCQGALAFNLDTSDLISQSYLTLVNN